MKAEAGEELLRSFSPLVAPAARLLILGSMPGGESLRRREYYGHPRNAFWFIISNLFDRGRPADELSYRERCLILQNSGIALWDVLRHCIRPGSLDGDIVPGSEIPNPLVEFCRQQHLLKAIAFNGRKAAAGFRRHILKLDPQPWRNLQLIELPSTSPAYAALTPDEKLEIWRTRLLPVFNHRD